jgi:hypothetical protein
MVDTSGYPYAEVMRRAADAFLNGEGGEAADIDQIVAYLATLVAEAEEPGAVNVYPLPDSIVSGLTTAMTGTDSTAVTGMGAPGATLYNHITAIVAGNTDADTGTMVQLLDGNNGTVFFTFPVPAAISSAGAVGNTIALPTPLKQPTADTALYAKNVTTGASVTVCVVGFKAP